MKGMLVREQQNFHMDLPTFICVGAANTQGVRSELEAITEVLEQAGYGSLRVDSSAAITLVNKALTVSRWQELASHEHCDLLIRVWEVRTRVQVLLEKVSAHQENDKSVPLLQLYWQWGNAYADNKAKDMAPNWQPSFTQTLDEFRRIM